jgi:hypothetical protein
MAQTAVLIMQEGVQSDVPVSMEGVRPDGTDCCIAHAGGSPVRIPDVLVSMEGVRPDGTDSESSRMCWSQ